MPELMKGHVWSKYKHKMTYPALAEFKYDEVRCHVKVLDNGEVQFLSYAGKPLYNLQHFATLWLRVKAACGLSEFDCGVLVRNSFADTYRYVRSSKGIPEDLRTKDVRFILFDLPGSTAEYSERSLWCEQIASRSPVIQAPTGHLVHGEADVQAAYTNALTHGVEGLMVKSLGHVYEAGKRTYGWLKVKPSEDADGVVVALHEAYSSDGTRTPLQRVGSVTIRCEDGSEATPHGIPHELGIDMYEHPEKYIGQWAEFQYMQRDRQGGYRHPVFHRLREAKSVTIHRVLT